MIAVDTNLLVYAHREDSPWHDDAYARIRELAEGPASWGVPWPCIHEFLAIVTHPGSTTRQLPWLRPWTKLTHGWRRRAWYC